MEVMIWGEILILNLFDQKPPKAQKTYKFQIHNIVVSQKDFFIFNCSLIQTIDKCMDSSKFIVDHQNCRSSKFVVIDSSVWRFISLEIHQFVDSSICRFINLEIHQFGDSSIWRFINLEIHQFGDSSVWRFISLEIHQFGDSSVWRFISLEIHDQLLP